jgi:hypothetical protein
MYFIEYFSLKITHVGRNNLKHGTTLKYLNYSRLGFVGKGGGVITEEQILQRKLLRLCRSKGAIILKESRCS